MMTHRLLTATIVLLVMSQTGRPVSAADASDPYGRRGSWTVLLKTKPVQKHLMLTAKQQAVADSLVDRKDDNLARITEILDEKQRDRLMQLSLQKRGGYVLFEPRLALVLRITDAQKEQLVAAAKINLAEYRKMRDFLTRARFRSREAMEKYIAGYRDAADKRLFDVLTATQRKTLGKELGPPLNVR